MKNLLAVALATSITIAMPMSAFAAEVAAAAATSAAAGASAMLTDKSTFADVTGSLSSAETAKLDITKMDAKTKVTIIKISTLTGYKAGVKMSATDMASMKNVDAKVMANAALSAKLKAEGYTPADVVAVSVDASGGMTIFVNK
jgi:hypothetical protein